MRPGYTLILTLAIAAPGPTPVRADPGGAFRQRLRAAAARARPTGRRPASGRRPAPSPAPKHAAGPPAARRNKRLPNQVVVRRTRSAARVAGTRGTYRPRPVEAACPAITYTVRPRSALSLEHEITGDLVLFADGIAQPVKFRWDGGSRLSRGPVVLKGMLAQEVRVTAALPGRPPLAWEWVPVKGNCITTVRFSFRSR